jgi:hypothetical protein
MLTARSGLELLQCLAKPSVNGKDGDIEESEKPQYISNPTAHFYWVELQKMRGSEVWAVSFLTLSTQKVFN